MITASLVSHTNAGKTTLARTLLARDIGEVRDAPHVTELAEPHLLVETADGESLMLCDTPGFGDSARLLERLRSRRQPLGWFLAEVWDRWRERAFWATQQALLQVRDRTDIVVYLVSAAETPAAAGYVAPEMELLAWVGKPVVVLVNQLGAPRPAAEEAAELARWQGELARWPLVRALLPFDAFARCWVQEFAFFDALGRALAAPGDGVDARIERLAAAWAAGRLATFERAMRVQAEMLARVALVREPQRGEPGWRERLLGLGGRLAARRAAIAEERLGRFLAEEVRTSTAALLGLYGIEGSATATILERVATGFERRERVDEGRAAVFGGVVSGALAGLKADLLAGGLTLGGGLLAGGLLGALGGAGLARGLNLVRGTAEGTVGFSAAALDGIAEAALLRYLAVAHFGRGRGRWAEGEAPAHWGPVVREALAAEREAFARAWATRPRATPDADAALTLTVLLTPAVARATRAALQTLYPGSWPRASGAGPGAGDRAGLGEGLAIGPVGRASPPPVGRPAV